MATAAAYVLSRPHTRRQTARSQSPRGVIPYLRSGGARTLLTAPVIYSLIVPFVLLDLWVSAYQCVCFRAWRIAPVGRSAFFVMDRHKLEYLNAIEKVNCTFCAYANGVLAYICEVAARTEQYWCPIKHVRRPRNVHRRYDRFFEYGDGHGYRTRLIGTRERLAPGQSRRRRSCRRRQQHAR